MWDQVLSVNLRGAMLTARAALPVLEDGGSIVFVSSVAGIKPGSRMPAYDASKAALGGLMRHVALEGERRRIRVNVVAPA
jgi:NAD(P)-dependent dehydrogenase (short-subunit alcohol dehydrogenase family)